MKVASVMLAFFSLVAPLPDRPLILSMLGFGSSLRATPEPGPSSRSPREEVIYTFRSTEDASSPEAPLIADASGSLYGTSDSGGGIYSCDGQTCGTVFKLTRSPSGYTESILYRFLGGTDGAFPLGGLVADASGALYGTTNIGGSANFGTVFKLTPNASGYSESILYSFQGGLDGRTPATALVADKRGALFGTTLFGGGSMTCKSGCGTVFKLTPTASGYRESVLHRFTAGTADGFYPDGTLLVEAGGSLLGTTEFGGTSASCISPGEDRCGTVFALKPTRSGYKERIVYNFQGPPNDGAWPMAGLVRGAGGMLYGTTSLGGSGTYKCCLSGSLRGCGATFRLVPSKSGYRESLLYSFRGGTDGYFPYAGVTAGPHGTLFGTTYYGGLPLL
jgi:uncharacterized repeat protein (TIGR03803 family)